MRNKANGHECVKLLALALSPYSAGMEAAQFFAALKGLNPHSQPVEYSRTHSCLSHICSPEISETYANQSRVAVSISSVSFHLCRREPLLLRSILRPYKSWFGQSLSRRFGTSGLAARRVFASCISERSMIFNLGARRGSRYLIVRVIGAQQPK